MKKFFVAMLSLLIMLLGCQAAPTVAPTTVPTQAPPPTLAATSTPAPTATATSAPLPQVSLETFIGTWTQFDTQLGSNNFLIFQNDGTYVARHGASIQQSAFVFEGKFVLTQDRVTLFNDRDCPDGETYTVTFTGQVTIRFDLSGETKCDFLAEDMKKLPRWMRYTGN